VHNNAAPAAGREPLQRERPIQEFRSEDAMSRGFTVDC
jgi:hypothetical protein